MVVVLWCGGLWCVDGADEVQLANYDAYHTGTKNLHRIMTMLFSLDDYAQVHISLLLDTGHEDKNWVHYRNYRITAAAATADAFEEPAAASATDVDEETTGTAAAAAAFDVAHLSQ